MGYSIASGNTTGQGTIALLKYHARLYRGVITSSATAREEILALQTGPGGAYGVVERTDLATGQKYRYGLVVITERRQGKFAWKVLDEFAGPRISSMPQRLLSLLTPLEVLAGFDLPAQALEYAAQWRRHAQADLERKAALADNNVIVFDKPLTFNVDGKMELVRRFRVLRRGRAILFQALRDGGGTFMCRIRRSSLQMSPYCVEGQSPVGA